MVWDDLMLGCDNSTLLTFLKNWIGIAHTF
jgi:hypothetical protein